MKTQTFFRYVWRIDVVLILFAAGAITFGVGVLVFQELGGRAALRHNAEAGVPITAEERLDLTLGHAQAIPGSPVLRADLFVYRVGAGFSSGGYNESRNILFIDPSQKASHWLLPDNDHVIAERSDVKDEKDATWQPIIATAVLVKPQSDQSELVLGRLLLFDANGKNTVEIASNVRDLHVATLNRDEITLLYERNRRLVLATFDSSSLARKREQEIEVPQLK